MKLEVAVRYMIYWEERSATQKVSTKVDLSLSSVVKQESKLSICFYKPVFVSVRVQSCIISKKAAV